MTKNIVLTNGRVIKPMSKSMKQLTKEQCLNILDITQTRGSNNPLRNMIAESKRRELKNYCNPVVSNSKVIKFEGSLGENPFIKLHEHVKMKKQDNEYTRIDL